MNYTVSESYTDNEIEAIWQETYLDAVARYIGDCIYEEGMLCENTEKKCNNQCDKCSYYIHYVK